MRILYICSLNYMNKAGLYNATMERIALVNRIHKVKLFSLLSKDSICKKILKKNLNIEASNFDINKYVYKGVECTNLIFKSKIKDSIYKKLGKDIDIEYYINIISNYIKNNEIDIIHAHWCYPQGYVAKKLSEKFSIPYVITAHGSDIHTIPYKDIKIKKRVLDSINNANSMFFVSNNLKEQAIELGYIPNRFIISNNGINLDIFRISNENIDNKKPRIGYVGNLVEVKGVNYIPKIFYNIKKEIDCEFEITGDGYLREELKKKINEYDIKCNFNERVNPNEIANIMGNLDILIVPSKNEGWGNVIIEANSMGTYVVGSNVGGIPEAIGKYGKVVDLGLQFEERFAEEVINVLNSGYCKKELIERGKSYEWKYIVNKEIYEYKKIIESRVN